MSDDETIAEPPAHDPTGLELAAQIAAQTARSRPILPPAEDADLTPRHPRRPRVFQEQRSGPGPDERDPQLLGSILDSVASTRGWRRQISLSMVLRDWARIVGPDNAQHSEPTHFADGVLTIQCDTTAWATGMRYLASQIVARLNTELGHHTVQRVEIRGPQQKNWKRGPRSVRDGRGPRDTYG